MMFVGRVIVNVQDRFMPVQGSVFVGDGILFGGMVVVGVDVIVAMGMIHGHVGMLVGVTLAEVDAQPDRHQGEGRKIERTDGFA